MTQLPLFRRSPRAAAPRNRIARRCDPRSSQLAAAETTRSGRRDAQAQMVLSLVRLWQGRTSRELAEGARVDRYIVARRLPELERLGLVRRGEMRICSIGHRLATTWEAV